jgi:hypothetical protein
MNQNSRIKENRNLSRKAKKRRLLTKKKRRCQLDNQLEMLVKKRYAMI